MSADRFCYDRCDACRHRHLGAAGGYRCPECSCSDRHDCERDTCTAVTK